MKKMLQGILIVFIMLSGINFVKAEENYISEDIAINIMSVEAKGKGNSNQEKNEIPGSDDKSKGESNQEKNEIPGSDDKSKGESNQEKNGQNISTTSCGSSTDIPAALPVFVHNVISLVKILVPILLIILGMLDFGKAVVSNDEKAMNESKNKFIKRIIGAIAVFLVVAVTQFIFKVINLDDSNDIISCIDCFINNNCQTHTIYLPSDESTYDELSDASHGGGQHRHE